MTVRATKTRIDGQTLFVVEVDLRDQLPDGLSDSERDIALRVLSGYSNREIAAARGTSTKTVGNQISALYRKLGLSSRFELARLVVDRGRR